MGNVYFIAAGNFVKIGYSTDLIRRMCELQVGNPTPLELRATVRDAGPQVERYFHDAFARDAVHGEWFKVSRRVQFMIHAIRGGAQPKTPDAIGTVLMMRGLRFRSDAKRDARIAGRPPTEIPEQLVGTEFESIITACDALVRNPETPPDQLRDAHICLRNALRGKHWPIDTRAAL